MNSNAVIVPPTVTDLLTNDIRGLKPLAEVAGSMAWLWWLLAVLTLIVVGLFLMLHLTRHRGTPPPIPVVPPHVIARQRLEQALSLISDPREFCTAVSDTIRYYLEARFEFHAPDRTTEEFMFELQGSDCLLPDQKESLAAFLQSCDLVKFARMEPTENALRELHASAGRLVDETEADALPSLTTPRPAPVAPPAPPPLPPALAETDEPAEKESGTS